MTTDPELPAHSENSPSTAAAWTVCEDYVNANRGLPDVQSWEAAEGTAAHWIRNECLTTGTDADAWIGHTQQVGRWDFTWTEDDARLLQPGIDWLRSHEGEFYGEHRVDLTEWVGLDSYGRPQGGTLDAGMKLTDGRYLVDDEKYGRGVPVRAATSLQIRLYALGFGREQGVTDPGTEFLLSIDQPRHMGGGGRVTVTWGELLEFGEWIKDRAEATRAPNPVRVASQESCMWCRRKIARGGCGTFEQYLGEVLDLSIADLDKGVVRMPEFLTPERRATLLLHEKMIVNWLEQMRDQALADALAGDPLPRLKAVDGRKDADRWEDEKGMAVAVVSKIHGDKSFTKKLKTPTQLAKEIDTDHLDWLLIEPLIKRGQRKPTLVPEDDERPAIAVTAGQINQLEDL